MAVKAGDLREILLESIERVRRREMKPDEANAISKLAQQVNLSLQVEINVIQAQLELRGKGLTDAIGELSLGAGAPMLPEPKPAIDMTHGLPTGTPRFIAGKSMSGGK